MVRAKWTLISYTKSYSYTGAAQKFTAPYTGYYKVELWGASGGTGWFSSQDTLINTVVGRGAYVSGSTLISKNAILYIYVGQGLKNATSRLVISGGWNGGGSSARDNDNNDTGGGGGGATDIRVESGSWDNVSSLRSRISVASGGGGTATSDYLSGSTTTAQHGGGIYNAGTLYDRVKKVLTVTANQVSGNAFGIGYTPTDQKWPNGSGGSGGGWYGGLYSGDSNGSYGVGGSSYISGHTGSVAVASTSSSSPKSGCTTGTTNNACSISPYGYTFTNTIMIDGAGYKWTNTKGALQQMPNPSGGYYASGVGHSGNGYARITWLGTNV